MNKEKIRKNQGWDMHNDILMEKMLLHTRQQNYEWTVAS